MTNKKSNQNSNYQDSNALTIMGLLLVLGVLYIDNYIDFSYIFSLSFWNNTSLSIVYLFLGILSLTFWSIAFGFISLALVSRYKLNIDILKKKEINILKNQIMHKLLKVETYFYLSIFCLITCAIFTISLRPHNYDELNVFLISV